MFWPIAEQRMNYCKMVEGVVSRRPAIVDSEFLEIANTPVIILAGALHEYVLPNFFQDSFSGWLLGYKGKTVQLVAWLLDVSKIHPEMLCAFTMPLTRFETQCDSDNNSCRNTHSQRPEQCRRSCHTFHSACWARRMRVSLG